MQPTELENKVCGTFMRIRRSLSLAFVIELDVQNGPSTVVPTITVEDADLKPKKLASRNPQSIEDTQSEQLAAPGALPNGLAPTIPHWYRVGWRHMSGIDQPPLPEGEEKDRGVLDMFLSEQFYGSWYHNAALIVFVRF